MMLTKESSTNVSKGVSPTRKLVDYTKQRKDNLNPPILKREQEKLEQHNNGRNHQPETWLNQDCSSSQENFLSLIPFEIEFSEASTFDTSGLGDSFRSLSDEWKKYDKELMKQYDEIQEEEKQDKDEVTRIDFYLKIPSKNSRRQRQKQTISSGVALREQFSRRDSPASLNRKKILQSLLDRMILEDNR